MGGVDVSDEAAFCCEAFAADFTREGARGGGVMGGGVSGEAAFLCEAFATDFTREGGRGG